MSDFFDENDKREGAPPDSGDGFPGGNAPRDGERGDGGPDGGMNRGDGTPYAGDPGPDGYPYQGRQYPPDGGDPYNNYYQNNYQNNGGYHSATPYGYEPPHAMKPQKGRSAGAKVLAALLVVAIMVSCVGIALSARNRGFIAGGSETTSSDGARKGIDNGPTVEFNATPANEPTTSYLGELQSTEVYKKIKESSVGVLVYSQTSQNLYTEGSGVILGEDSAGEYTYIITCAHVISDSGILVHVQLFDGTDYEAAVMGVDTRTDIGVLRIKESGLKAAEFGDSSLLEVGQTVYAIGNPGGTEFAGSFTAGMVSAIDRPVDSSSSGYTMECIQHHAAINPGNSGGALVNAYGQVVGINSMKIVDEYEGMGFAVPSKVFRGVVDLLITHGYVPDRPKLGITYSQASTYNKTFSMIVQIKELPAGSIVIRGIASDSPLLNTDVKVNDMIIAVNGSDLTSTKYLQELIENSKVGDKLKLTIVRVSADYKTTQFDVSVALVEDRGTQAGTAVEETTAGEFPTDFFFPFD